MFFQIIILNNLLLYYQVFLSKMNNLVLILDLMTVYNIS